MPRPADPYRRPTWLLLPGTRTYPRTQVHRVDPLAADVTMCGRQTKLGTVVPHSVQRIPQCVRCNHRVARRRQALQRHAERVDELARRLPAPDRSVRAVSAGLPTLGKRP